MGLSNDLITQFVKTTKATAKRNDESTVYGTTKLYDGAIYVQLDGSELLTPVSTTTAVEAGERVAVRIKDHTATITGNISFPAAKNITVQELGDEVATFNKVLADKVSVVELEAVQASIDSLIATDADIYKLTATFITADDVKAKYVSTDQLEADYITTAEINSIYATIADLNATNAVIDTLTADVADIDTLIFGSASGATIQTSFANAVIAQLGNAQIKSAMIESVSAGKITAGDIVTNDVRVMSNDGKLLISDETIQISDSARVRVQIGKDASDDYSINIWDVEGNLMFSEGGITGNAIKNAIIRNDMVREDANISASKLDIGSLFKEINGSTETIKATKIYLDDKEQTLDVAFTKMVSDVGDLSSTVSSQGTKLSVIQGQINNKIWQSDINAATGALSDKYSELNQEVGKISATVASQETTVSSLSKKVTEVTAGLDGFKSTVSDTYATKQQVDGIEIGARNLIRNSTTMMFVDYHFANGSDDGTSAIVGRAVVGRAIVGKG